MLEYLHAFNQGLINIMPFSPQGTETFLYMMFGMAIGFAVGILPGLGGATTLALMLPFIYNMAPDDGVRLSPRLQRRHRHDRGYHFGSLRSSGRRHMRRDDCRWPSDGQKRRGRPRARRSAHELAGWRSVWCF